MTATASILLQIDFSLSSILLTTMGTLIEIDPLDTSPLLWKRWRKTKAIHLLKELFKGWIFVAIAFSLIVKMVMAELVTDDFTKDL